MQFTLFGYPKSGKTTLFNLLTGAGIEVSAYDKGKRDPHLRTLAIPDNRLDRLAALYPEKEKKAAAVDFVDLAGMAYGEVKDSIYLSHLRKAEGLAHVIRAFEDENIPHPRGRIDAAEDMRALEEELIITDALSIESRLEKLRKELMRNRTQEGEKESDLLQRLAEHLGEGRPARIFSFSSWEEKMMRSFALLSGKPLLHVVNVDEKNIPDIRYPEKLLPAPSAGTKITAFCGSIESEIMDLDESEKKVFMEEYGLFDLSVRRFLQSASELLDMITFYTIGDREVKAWMIVKGATALDAAGIIHSDIAKGFIKAETISLEDLLSLGSLQSAKAKAAIRLEGKEYSVQDGDVLYFRFSK